MMEEDPKRSQIQWAEDDEEAPPPLPAPALAAAIAAIQGSAAAENDERSSLDQLYREEDFEADDEPFDRPDAQKLGIIGGKGVGKSYLFQAMVYRALAGNHSGALTYYLGKDGIRLFIAEGGAKITRTGAARTLNRAVFIEKYQNWQRLPTTLAASQQWYRLRLLLRSGWLGRRRSAMDVEFFDGSGEGFFELPTVSEEDRTLWRKAYGEARVMIFCLPLWAAFPDAQLTDEDWAWRERLLKGFDQVLGRYGDMRAKYAPPVTSILALTMADDRRSALRTLYDRWISPCLDSPHTHLRQLRTGAGIARYLANARKVSEALHEELASARDPRVSAIPQDLDFGRGRPWIIPLSAMEGARLDELEQKYANRPDDTARLREARAAAPTPVHVELPLLVALCERENALM